MSRINVARKFFLTAGLSLVASTLLAQQPPAREAARANPYVSWFNSLTPAAQQQIIAALPAQLAHDLATPEAWRGSTQVCASVGPLESCQSLDGNGYSVGLVEGMRITADRDERGWNLGVTANGEVPLAAAAGVANSVSYYPATGNVQVCEGGYVGIPNVMTAGVQQCQTLDRSLAAEIQSARTQIGTQQSPPSSYQTPASTMASLDTQTLRAIELELRRRAGENTYNPPADMVAPSAPGNSEQVAARPVATLDQFQADLNRQMQRFQAEAASQEAAYRSQQAVQPAAAPVGNLTQGSAASAPANTTAQSARITYDEYANRNGYDADGNRADSTRRQYDAQGYHTNRASSSTQTSPASSVNNRPVPASAQPLTQQVPASQPMRQNRVYSTDGTSRPIGRNYNTDSNYSTNDSNNNAVQQYVAVQNWSQQQIARQQAGRANSSASSSNLGGNSAMTVQSVSTQSNVAQSSPASSSSASNNVQNANSSTSSANSYAPRNTIVYDDNAPRSNGTSNAAVTPRSNGTPASTANLGPAVSARRTGTESQTASLRMPKSIVN